MKSVKEIYKLVQTFYTPMSMEQELTLLQYLQKLDNDDILHDAEKFYSILDLLYESQVDNYVFENDVKMHKEIKSFICWLERLKELVGINKYKIEDILDVFNNK